jgi:hypothetical protein
MNNNWNKTKFVNGTVVLVDSAPSSTQKRAVTLITADYDLGGGTIKRHQLNSRSVKAGEATLLMVALPEPVTESVIENSQPIIPTTIAPTAAPNDAIVPSVRESIDDGETVTLEPSIASPDPPFLQRSPPRARIMPRANPVEVVASVHGIDWVKAYRTRPSP